MKRASTAILVPLTVFTLAAVAATLAPEVLAQGAPAPEPTTLTNPLGVTDVNVFIGRVISAVLGMAGAVALVMFVWGGVQWLISGGKPETIKKGKDTLIWATLGIVVIFTSYTLVNAVIAALSSGTVS